LGIAGESKIKDLSGELDERSMVSRVVLILDFGTLCERSAKGTALIAGVVGAVMRVWSLFNRSISAFSSCIWAFCLAC
jgi:hypothetical protein